ncbi:MAG: PCYCGC domain-containing protein [Chloroflexi bacterium]|nr:PCYCGC domain-containing protein [Chloroflexota bacterium]
MRRVSTRTSRKLTRRHALQGALAASGLALVGCSSGVGQSSADDALLAWPAEDRWPEQFYKASARIQETYRYAVANQDLLQWMPCFCGCGEWGHKSNAGCYVQEMRNDGSVLLDPMSYG